MADVLVVDDQATWRTTLTDLVRITPGLDVVGEASSGEDALEAVELLAPQLVLMDIRMPGIGGIEATRRLRAARPDIVVVLVSVDGRDADVVGESGAAAIVRKHELSAGALSAAWREHGPG